MNNLQKWLLVLALWVFAIGVLLNAFHGRYKMAVMSETSPFGGINRAFTSARFDTWTGQVEVKDNIGLRWQEGSSYSVEELK